MFLFKKCVIFLLINYKKKINDLLCFFIVLNNLYTLFKNYNLITFNLIKFKKMQNTKIKNFACL